MGDLKTSVSQLIYKWRLEQITDYEFEIELQRIIKEFSNLGPLIFQDIGLIVRERQGKNRTEEETNYLWKLLDEADPRIRTGLLEFDKKMKR